ncbi:PAS domain-containing protein [Nesterenkonia sp. MY13]|uniref:PAS domain-containing protein n=1 Tax=Nesterenkonia sedimenti TaxID=1463632 RepID=A0A7X8YEM1_9MICC|nr:PAS domain-containing protein [Nesterenkonia sedimenti]NLS10372.1 PAS domain-containing protein [Nesterenkonia sedimenti]
MSSTADTIFATLTPALEGIAATFGPNCEVVLHDYRTPEQSVHAVAGNVTGRQAGGAMSEIGLRMLNRGADAENDLNYFTRSPDGRRLKCSTMPLRDENGELIGALCINIDVTNLVEASSLLAQIAGEATSGPPADSVTVFANDIDEVIDSIVGQEEINRSKPAAELTKQERLEVISHLNSKGIFSVRRAAPRVAGRLKISRAALYNDLKELSSQGSAS